MMEVQKYLKSNLIPATFPDEIFQFQISYDKNENRWKYLREKIKEKPLLLYHIKTKYMPSQLYLLSMKFLGKI